MALDYFIQSGGKQLRCGYTTGTCAALAAAGAARLLLTGNAPESLCLMTPKGVAVEAPAVDGHLEADTALCAVAKDGGDDVDATHGALIYAQVRRNTLSGVSIDGGEGVGRVTKPGLDQPVGAAAINRVPRQMIEQQVQQVCDELGYDGGLQVLIVVPKGEEIAAKTFNPRMGIEGGISILGTSGIVEPMSVQALIDTIALELRQAAATGAKQVMLTPGSYGERFILDSGYTRLGVPMVRCSNFIGEALDEAAALGFEQVLLIGHAGKLVKLAGGIMNTHSRWADCRTELICAHAAVCGAGQAVCADLLQAATTDACIEILDKAGLRAPVMARLMAAVADHLKHRAACAYTIGAVLFSNQYGPLGMTPEAEEILEAWKK